MKLNYFKIYIDNLNSREYLFPTLRICRILEGSCSWQIGDALCYLEKGDIILLNNLIPRTLLEKSQEKLIIEVFEFKPRDLKINLPLLNLFYLSPSVFKKDEAFLLSSALSLAADGYSNDLNDDFFTHVFSSVFILLERSLQYKAPKSPFSALPFDAANFIWEHYDEDINVSKIAKLLNVSKSRLENVFKKVFGVGVGEYLRSVRIYHVSSELESDSERNVLDIALSCGFSSSSGFYKAYKSASGRLPRRNKVKVAENRK